MKLYTNKFPVLGILTIDKDNLIDRDSVEIQFEEGKIFKVLGITYQDVVLECEGVAIYIQYALFAMAFTETDVGYL